MTLSRDIHNTRKRLIAKWKRYGAYENFGQKEVRYLRDKHHWLELIYGSPEEREQAQLIDSFDDWCMNYTG